MGSGDIPVGRKNGGCAGTLGLSHCGVTYKYGLGLKASLVRAGSTLASCGFTEKLTGLKPCENLSFFFLLKDKGSQGSNTFVQAKALECSVLMIRCFFFVSMTNNQNNCVY